MIKEFQGEYRWLSNFWPCIIYAYPSVEHAYQAMKTLDQKQREQIRLAPTAAAAKKLGRSVTVRTDWNDIKLRVMEVCLRCKFKHQDLRAKLIATKGLELIEGNWWNDTYWGVCKGKGENHLGKLLMKIRSEL